jgi:hypothetical protein
VTDAYKRYLENRFRTAFKLKGTPLAHRIPYEQKPVRRIEGLTRKRCRFAEVSFAFVWNCG